MNFLPPHSSSIPRLQVEDVGRPHLRVKMSDIWTYFLEAGVVDDGNPFYTFFSSYCQTHAYNSFRFNPTSPFGKAILKIPFYHRLDVIQSCILASIWLQKPYFLQKRIRHCLLCKPQSPITNNLIRLILKQPTSQPQHTQPIPQTHRHKSSFQPIHITTSTPLLFRPPMIAHYGLSLPRRHPRAGVG